VKSEKLKVREQRVSSVIPACPLFRLVRNLSEEGCRTSRHDRWKKDAGQAPIEAKLHTGQAGMTETRGFYVT